MFCVSEPLREKVAERGAPHAVVLPNGCDFDAYSDAPPMPRHTDTPVIGYVGTVAPRVDVELIARLARLRPTWTFDMVGPVSPLVQLPSDRPPNLRWAGKIPYDAVPARIRSWDVCILPLREIDYAHRSSPIQVFDYLAAGKPVVSSPVAQFEAWPDLVTTARGAEGFSVALEGALRDDSAPAQDRRRQFARHHSWDARVAMAHLPPLRLRVEHRRHRSHGTGHTGDDRGVHAGGNQIRAHSRATARAWPQRIERIR